jgi:hypothetical protein
VAFQADFEPLANMQREVGAAADTVYWNFGMCNFRLSARDLDGEVTMEDFYRYTLVDGEPERTWDIDDPAADPETGWIRAPFGAGEVKEFEIELRGVSPGPRTLTVSVRDESLSDTRLQYGWEVRAPRGPVLWVPDNTSSLGRAFFSEALDAAYGAGAWDRYDFLYGFPDRPWVLLESFRLFDVVLWSDGGTTSRTLQRAAARSGVLEQLVFPADGSPAGRLMIVSRSVTGAESDLPPVFIGNVLKLSPTGLPAVTLVSFGDLQILGDESWLPPMTCGSDFAKAIGLRPAEGCQAIYRFEECCERGCFGIARPNPDDPCDPVVVARWPERSAEPRARVISVGLQPEYFERAEAVAVFGALLTVEMGAVIP